MLKSFQTLMSTPFGGVAVSLRKGVMHVDLLTESLFMQYRMQEDMQSEHPLIIQVSNQIKQYLSKSVISFVLPLDLNGTPYQKKVWQAILEIPYGQTRTYGELAQQICSGPRAVANACGENSLPLLIPCHRVVAKNGLGGFMQGQHNGLLIKRWLLAHEGIVSYEHK